MSILSTQRSARAIVTLCAVITIALRAGSLGAQVLSAQIDEPRAFIGITIGPAIPFGVFADKTNRPEAGRAKLGYNDTFVNFGKRIGSHFGIAGSFFYDEHDMEDPAEDDWWQVAGLTAGPMYSTPLSPRTILDLKLKFGLLTTKPIVDQYEVTKGSGFVTDARVALRYNVHRRWCLLAESGVVVGNQSLQNGGEQGVRILVTGVGVAYRPSW